MLLNSVQLHAGYAIAPNQSDPLCLNVRYTPSMSEKKKKLAVLANVIAPYRVPILASLADTFDTLILHGGTEPNRTWNVELPQALKSRRVFTLQIPLRKKTGTPGISDTTYLHLNV